MANQAGADLLQSTREKALTSPSHIHSQVWESVERTDKYEAHMGGQAWQQISERAFCWLALLLDIHVQREIFFGFCLSWRRPKYPGLGFLKGFLKRRFPAAERGM